MDERRGTYIGVFAVLTWGASIPVSRLLAEQIGIARSIGIVFGACGIAGLLLRIRYGQSPLQLKVYREPLLYARWFFFVLHELLINIALILVTRENFPFVVLLNYIWPTAIILCSVLFAGVKITHWKAFLFGTAIVIISIALEVMQGIEMSSELFIRGSDCIAYVLAATGAISWGMYSALSRRSGDQSGGGAVVPLFQLTLGLALPLSLLLPTEPWALSTASTGLLVAFVLLQTAAYSAWDFGMRKGNIVLLSLFADFIPWISLFATTILLSIDLSLTTIASAVSLVVGAMITRYGTISRAVRA